MSDNYVPKVGDKVRFIVATPTGDPYAQDNLIEYELELVKQAEREKEEVNG